MSFIQDTNVENFYNIHWGYEHPLSFIGRNSFACLFNGKASYEPYSGIDVYLSATSTVNITVEGSFGANSPQLRLPANPDLLRDIASVCNKLSETIEAK